MPPVFASKDEWFVSGKHVMGIENVRDQFGQAQPLKISRRGYGQVRARCEHSLQLLQIDSGGATGISQEFLSAAAVIDPGFLKHPRGLGNLERQFTHGFCRIKHHGFSLVFRAQDCTHEPERLSNSEAIEPTNDNEKKRSNFCFVMLDQRNNSQRDLQARKLAQATRLERMTSNQVLLLRSKGALPQG
jgi:hypothetical protein